MYAQPQTETPTAVVMNGGRVMYLSAPCEACQQAHMGNAPCSGCQQRRLGVGTAVGEAVGKGIVSAAAEAGPAAPIVAAVGAVVEAISSFFGGGCGAACTESASLEQVPEVALDDLWAVAQKGMIGQADFLNAYNAILTYGIQQLQNLEKTDSKAVAGITNLQKSTASYQGLASSLPVMAPVALNLTTAQELFTNPAAPKWEPGSVEAGNNLALQVLQTIASAGANGTVNALTSATGLPEWTLLLGAAGLLWVILR